MAHLYGTTKSSALNFQQPVHVLCGPMADFIAVNVPQRLKPSPCKFHSET